MYVWGIWYRVKLYMWGMRYRVIMFTWGIWYRVKLHMWGMRYRVVLYLNRTPSFRHAASKRSRTCCWVVGEEARRGRH